MTTVAIIQARMGSSRFPGKMLSELGGRPVIFWPVEAAKRISGVDQVVVATSVHEADDAISLWCEENDVSCYRGPENDVLSRYEIAARAENADIVVRLTGDCPLLDPHVCAEVLTLRAITNADYATNADPATWPDGLDCEVITRDAFDCAVANATLSSEREHVTPYIRNRRHTFKIETLICPIPGLTTERWTLDTREDLDFLRAVSARLKNGHRPAYTDILAILEKEPQLREINSNQVRNEGYALSLTQDSPRPDHNLSASFQYGRKRSQLITKSSGENPDIFLSHGEGGRVWDFDGNEYVDLLSGELGVILGHRDKEVDEAVRAQIGNGTSGTLTSELEMQLAKSLQRRFPFGEKIHFRKTHSEILDDAIVAARKHTKRTRIAQCQGGICAPFASTFSDSSTHLFPYGSLQSVDELFGQYPGEFAALVLEPVNTAPPPKNYLSELKALTHAHGAVFIFDERSSGLRCAPGGAQEHFGVTPDLSIIGNALGNGMAVSALLGRDEIMARAGIDTSSCSQQSDPLSLAAALAVAQKMEHQNVVGTLWETGAHIADGIKQCIADLDLENSVRLVGLAPQQELEFSPSFGHSKASILSLFKREMARSGVFFHTTYAVCHAHSQDDIAKIIAATHDALKTCVNNRGLGHQA